MSHIPLSHALKSVFARKLTTVLTAGGMALVAFVFAAVLMLSQGARMGMTQAHARDLSRNNDATGVAFPKAASQNHSPRKNIHLCTFS